MARAVFHGRRAAQHPEVVGVFRELVAEHRWACVVEFGTMDAGLTLLLHELYLEIWDKPVNMVTFDVGVRWMKRGMLPSNIFPVVADLYADDCAAIGRVLQGGHGNRLILCDAGRDKSVEFNAAVPHLAYGDVIMAHDYFCSEESFAVNANFDWWQFDPRNIHECHWQVLREHRLAERFEPYAWACYEFAGAKWEGGEEKGE